MVIVVMCEQPVATDGFFFQAEDGIRDGHVTGVQTCALPIFVGRAVEAEGDGFALAGPDGHAAEVVGELDVNSLGHLAPSRGRTRGKDTTPLQMATIRPLVSAGSDGAGLDPRPRNYESQGKCHTGRL